MRRSSRAVRAEAGIAARRRTGGGLHSEQHLGPDRGRAGRAQSGAGSPHDARADGERGQAEALILPWLTGSSPRDAADADVDRLLGGDEANLDCAIPERLGSRIASWSPVMPPPPFDVTISLSTAHLIGTPHQRHPELAVEAVRYEVEAIPGASWVSVEWCGTLPAGIWPLIDRLEVVGSEAGHREYTARLYKAVEASVLTALRDHSARGREAGARRGAGSGPRRLGRDPRPGPP